MAAIRISCISLADHSIDGVNQWLTISKEHPSRRKEFVYGLNQLTGKAAIRQEFIHQAFSGFNAAILNI